MDRYSQQCKSVKQLPRMPAQQALKRMGHYASAGEAVRDGVLQGHEIMRRLEDGCGV